jgi:hypothetical protein
MQQRRELAGHESGKREAPGRTEARYQEAH